MWLLPGRAARVGFISYDMEHHHSWLFVVHVGRMCVPGKLSYAQVRLTANPLNSETAYQNGRVVLTFDRPLGSIAARHLSNFRAIRQL